MPTMLYEKAKSILDRYPPPRVRAVLKTGEVIETPHELLAAVSPGRLAISADGEHARVFRWTEIADFDAIPHDSKIQ